MDCGLLLKALTEERLLFVATSRDRTVVRGMKEACGYLANRLDRRAIVQSRRRAFASRRLQRCICPRVASLRESMCKIFGYQNGSGNRSLVQRMTGSARE